MLNTKLCTKKRNASRRRPHPQSRNREIRGLDPSMLLLERGEFPDRQREVP